MYNHQEQQTRNQRAITDPKAGDFWHEMFCPYFLVVDVRDDKIGILSCISEPKAKIDNKDGTYSFDYSKTQYVDRTFIEKKVTYESISGFVADVRNSKKSIEIVSEWRDFTQKEMRKQIKELESKWEEFTGWSYLKKEFVNE